MIPPNRNTDHIMDLKIGEGAIPSPISYQLS